ncbi:MAG: 50S ribosomal protein L18, partial [Prochlorothrix sp.]
MKLTRRESIQRRHRRIRQVVVGTPERPRLSVFRSNNHIYAQVIDDSTHHTLVSASSLDPELRENLDSGRNCSASEQVGQLIAKRAKAQFDFDLPEARYNVVSAVFSQANIFWLKELQAPIKA